MELTPSNADQFASQFLANLKESHVFGSGRGIVTCAGGIKYNTCAWVLIRLLRDLGCELPIEVWYLGEDEGDRQWIELVKQFGVTCIDAHQVQQQHPHPRLRGWELKPYAILHSRFREVLFLDADNVPVRDPSFLFETFEYTRAGTVFWPDPPGFQTPIDSVRWQIFGASFREGLDQESGQLLIDKEQAWRALCLCNWYNEHSDFYYQHIYGDKDTFRFAWQRLGQPVHWIAAPASGQIPFTLCQHDLNGSILFQHRHAKKWQLFGDNANLPGFQHDDKCRAYIEELRERWEPQRHLMRKMSDADRRQASELTERQFRYEKPGINSWPIRLGLKGRVSEGYGPNEFFWWIEGESFFFGGTDGGRRGELHRSGESWHGRRLDRRHILLRLNPIAA